MAASRETYSKHNESASEESSQRTTESRTKEVTKLQRSLVLNFIPKRYRRKSVAKLQDTQRNSPKPIPLQSTKKARPPLWKGTSQKKRNSGKRNHNHEDDASEATEMLLQEQHPQDKINLRVLLDEESIDSMPRKKQAQQMKVKRKAMPTDDESTNSATHASITVAAEPGNQTGSHNKNTSLPSVPEDVLPSKRDRLKKARVQSAIKARIKRVRAEKERKRTANIIPNSRGLAPKKYRRRQKGEIPNDARAAYLQAIKTNTRERKRRQQYRRTQNPKTTRQEFEDASNSSTSNKPPIGPRAKKPKPSVPLATSTSGATSTSSATSLAFPNARSIAQQRRRKREREEGFVNPNISPAQQLRRERERQQAIAQRNQTKGVYNLPVQDTRHIPTMQNNLECSGDETTASAQVESGSKCSEQASEFVGSFSCAPTQKSHQTSNATTVSEGTSPGDANSTLPDEEGSNSSSSNQSTNTFVQDSHTSRSLCDQSSASHTTSSNCSGTASDSSCNCTSSNCHHGNKRQKVERPLAHEATGQKKKNKRKHKRNNGGNSSTTAAKSRRAYHNERQRKRRQAIAESNVVPPNLSVDDFPALLRRLEKNPDQFFQDSQRDVNKSLLLYYLNSGYAQYDQYKEYDANSATHEIDKAKIIRDIQDQQLSDNELHHKLKEFFANHSYTDAKLLSCGCCGIRMRERLQSPEIRFRRLYLKDPTSTPLMYTDRQMENLELRKNMTPAQIPIDGLPACGAHHCGFVSGILVNVD